MPRLELTSRWSRTRALVVLAFCCFAVLGWQGVTTVGHNGAIDAGEHLHYAQILADTWRLPNKSQDYEYASPPLFHVVAVGAEKLVHELPAVAAQLPSNAATRGIWLALAALGVAGMTAAGRRIRIAGAAAVGLTVLWGLDEAIMLCKSEEWSAGQLIALASGAGLIVVTGLLAREVWPDHPRRAIAAGAFAAAYPVVYRMSILFHPEVPFALLCSTAMLLFLRASRRGWPPRLGLATGAACGAAALTRQPAVLVALCLAAAAVAVGGRAARGFVLRGALAVVLLAGPWWGYATWRWHNPLQSNLQLAPDHMLSRQPASFYFGVPLRTLVVHPYRPDFTNEFLPKLHAELWSDWFGALHAAWASPSTLDKVTASTQSVLGFVGDALGLGGLAALAIPAGIRTLRRRSRAPDDVGLGVLGFVALAAFALFVVTLLRFPQRDGDPIKSSYLLFTTPCWSLSAVAAWAEVRRRSKRTGLVLIAAAVLYGASYGTELASALSHPGTVGNGNPLPNALALHTSFQQTSPTPGPGGEIDFLIEVDDTGGRSASDVTLTVDVPTTMTLPGYPAVTHGICSGGVPIHCELDPLRAGTGNFIRIALNMNGDGPQTLTAVATATDGNGHTASDTATYTVVPST